jgi:predicted nuclease of predicted toxin-antitoxin system
MKFLIDESLPHLVVKILKEDFEKQNVSFMRDMFSEGITDKEWIHNLRNSEDFWCFVTKDRKLVKNIELLKLMKRNKISAFVVRFKGRLIKLLD